MAYPFIDIDAGGPLTAADLDRAIAAGNTGRILPHGIDLQGRYETRRWGQSRDDEHQWAAGINKPATEGMPRVIPLSTLARWFLALRRWWRG